MSAGNSASSGVQLCEELLELATPDLYRNNLFRVLAVPVNAGPAEVRQRHKKLAMQRKLGLSAESVSVGLFPLTPPPSSEVVAKSIERMNDPVARFLDEFFWFSAPPGDAGLAALERGNLMEARSHWKRLASSSAAASHGSHNLAVMEHILALESSNAEGTASVALASWKAALTTEALWDRVRARVGELNDVRLTTGFVRRHRETLPRMLLLIFARQAVAASERGDTKQAAELLKVIRESGYGSEIVDEVIREAFKPLRSRISAAVASAKNRWAKTPQHGDRIVRELHQTVQPLLAIYDRVADSDLARQGVHDEVGEAMILAEVVYTKATNNWAEGEKLLALAQSVAMGQRLRDQIVENIKIDQENAKSGNDWCAPGYWDLAPDVVAELEKARTHTLAGNFDAALEILLSMDKQIGFPLKRAAAYSMSVKSIRKYNEALGEYQAIRPMYKKIMDRLPDRWNLPTPQTPSYLMPPCLACGSTSYTSWQKFTYRGNNLFMCTSCNEEDDEEIARRKRKMVGVLTDIMDHLALAARLDPQDPGISRNRDGIKKDAADFGYFGDGDWNALVKRLAKQRVRRTVVAAIGTATDTCFFCGQRPGDASAALIVPMHGPVTRTEFLFGSGTAYDYGDVIVPRCVECRQHHAEWPKNIEVWHEEALRAADLEHFPEACAAVEKTRQTAEAMAKGSSLAGQSVERARAALVRAEESQGFISSLFGRPNPARDAAYAAAETAQRQQKMAALRVQEAAAGHKLAQAALQGLRERAVATYKAANPQPRLLAGIRPEHNLTQASAIVNLQRESWSFGHNTEEDGGGEPVVKGTVSRSAELPPFIPV